MEYTLLPRFDNEMMEAAPEHPGDSASYLLPTTLTTHCSLVSKEVSEFIPR